MMAEPRRLTLGVLTGYQFGSLTCCLQRQGATQIRGQFRHPMRPHGRQRGVQVHGKESTHFIDGTGSQHRGEAGGDGPAQDLTRGIEADREEAPRRRRQTPALPGGETHAGAAPDFPRSGNPLTIVGFDPRGRRRIDFAEAGMQHFGTAFDQQTASLRARVRPRMRSDNADTTSPPSITARTVRPRSVPQSSSTMMQSCATSTRRRVR